MTLFDWERVGWALTEIPDPFPPRWREHVPSEVRAAVELGEASVWETGGPDYVKLLDDRNEDALAELLDAAAWWLEENLEAEP